MSKTGKFHLSTKTGKPEPCNATIGVCPYPNNPHGNSKQEVLEATAKEYVKKHGILAQDNKSIEIDDQAIKKAISDFAEENKWTGDGTQFLFLDDKVSIILEKSNGKEVTKDISYKEFDNKNYNEIYSMLDNTFVDKAPVLSFAENNYKSEIEYKLGSGPFNAISFKITNEETTDNGNDGSLLSNFELKYSDPKTGKEYIAYGWIEYDLGDMYEEMINSDDKRNYFLRGTSGGYDVYDTETGERNKEAESKLSNHYGSELVTIKNAVPDAYYDVEAREEMIEKFNHELWANEEIKNPKAIGYYKKKNHETVFYEGDINTPFGNYKMSAEYAYNVEEEDGNEHRGLYNTNHQFTNVKTGERVDKETEEKLNSYVWSDGYQTGYPRFYANSDLVNI